MRRQDETDGQARQDRARYERIFQPLEENLVNDANRYNSDTFQNARAGRAAADVSAQFALARTAAVDQLESYGIDPSQTRASALDLGMRTQEAASRAGAANQERDRTAAQGAALRSEAINVGRGYPGQVAQSYGLALQSGNQAVNSGLATTASGASTMGTGLQWQGAGNQAIGNWSNALTSGYNNQLNAFKANQSQSSGIGGILGTVAGLGIKAATGGMFEEGGPVDNPPNDPGAQHHSGVIVDPAVSPSRGVIPDDVPARLNAGEFVVPKDVVAWKGQEWLQKLIQSSRTKAQEAPAKAKPGVLPVERPVINTAGVLPAMG